MRKAVTGGGDGDVFVRAVVEARVDSLGEVDHGQTALPIEDVVRREVGVDAVVPAFLIIVLGGVGSLWGAVVAGLMVGMVVALTGAYASEWSLLSMYLLFIAVVTFRARGLFGKKSVLDT